MTIDQYTAELRRRAVITAERDALRDEVAALKADLAATQNLVDLRTLELRQAERKATEAMSERDEARAFADEAMSELDTVRRFSNLDRAMLAAVRPVVVAALAWHDAEGDSREETRAEVRLYNMLFELPADVRAWVEEASDAP